MKNKKKKRSKLPKRTKTVKTVKSAKSSKSTSTTSATMPKLPKPVKHKSPSSTLTATNGRNKFLVSLPVELVIQLDQYAGSKGMNRSATIEAMIRQGL